MKIIAQLLLIFTLTFVKVSAQIDKKSDLFLTLKQQDSLFFERSFNRCDIEYLTTAIHPDLQFYHDQGGIQTKEFFLENVKKNICADISKKPIRKVDEQSLEVYPMYNNGVLYGAIQSGIHDFYIREKNKVDLHTNRAKFTHLYLLENGKWLLKEVLSYDHKTPLAIEPKLTLNQEIENLLIAQKVPQLGLGIIENGVLKNIQVFGKTKAESPAPYNTIFNVASLTKPVTALVALKLVSSGKLGLDEPLNTYWVDPDLKNDKRTSTLTPRILLSHQSGFPNWRYQTKNNKLAFEFDPGTKFQYSGEGYEYLRKALEVKFGKKLEVLADSLIFKPAKMFDTHFWWDKSVDEKRYSENYDKLGKIIPTEKHHTANAADNLLTTVEDYGNFLAYVLKGADLSDELVQEMNKNQIRLKDRDYFCLGWEKLTDFSNNEYALIHSGKDAGVSTLAVIFPKSKNGYLIFMNGDNSSLIFEKIITNYLYLGNEFWNRR